MNIEQKMVLFADRMGNNNSKDPSTKVGAVICDGLNVMTCGYNGLPRGIHENIQARIDRNNTVNGRPVKYSWFEHGERNAIYNVIRNADLMNNKILLVSGEIDIEDLRCAVSAGVKNLIVVLPEDFNSERKIIDEIYSDEIAIEMLNEAKMNYCVLKRYTDSVEMFAEIFNNESVLSANGIKSNKLMKKIEQAEIFKEIFAEDYELQGADAVPFKKVKSSALIFDKTNYNDLSVSCSGITEDLIAKLKPGKDLKSKYGQGAIRNTIYSSISTILKGKSIFVNLCPCIDCAKAIATTGISSAAYGEQTDPEILARWGKSFQETYDYLDAFGVEVKAVKMN